jgi:hypothetical protein
MAFDTKYMAIFTGKIYSDMGICRNLVLSLILARMLITEVLGLPPQDFDVTVRVWTLLFYLPVWAFIFVVLAFVFVLITFFINIPLSLISSSTILDIFLKKNRWKVALDKHVFRNFGHVLGAFMFGSLIAMGLDQFPAVVSSLEPAIRLTAYYADYQMVSRYPGVDVTKKLRVHTNGLVSYAEKHGWDVIISVEKIKPVSSLEQSSSK